MSQTLIRYWFQAMDRKRRQYGRMLDRMGYGPSESASRTLLATPAMKLRFYGGEGPALLIVPAPIKRHYIWDICPERSVVQHALRRGMQVYLVEWNEPGEAENDFGLDQYGYELLEQCVDAITATRFPPKKIFLLGHSLGGVLAAIYAALRPQRIAGLVLNETPLHFGRDTGVFAPLVALSPPTRQVVPLLSPVPGSLLSLVSASASPATFQIERYADFVASIGSTEDVTCHMRVERWTMDEAAMAERLFEQVVEQLYREDNFMRRRLMVGGKRIGPDDLAMPLLAVYDPRSTIIPPAAVSRFCEAAHGGARLLAYRGDIGVCLSHVGPLVGRNAHASLWPEIFDWVSSLGALRH